MKFEKVVKKRQSVRKFEQKEISEEKIIKVLELANLSPSAGNLQARKIVVIKDQKTKEAIVLVAYDQDFISEASIVFVICADLEESAKEYGQRGKELYAIQDATIFASYLELTVASLGLSSCWVGAFEEKAVGRILGLPKGLKPVAIIPAGYAAEKPIKTPRKNLDEIIIKHQSKNN